MGGNPCGGVISDIQVELVMHPSCMLHPGIVALAATSAVAFAAI